MPEVKNSTYGVETRLNKRVLLIWLIPSTLLILSIWIVLLLVLLPSSFENFQNEQKQQAIILAFGVSILVVIVSTTYVSLKYLHFSYSLGKEALIITEGILIKRKNAVPYSSIQNVSTKQNFAYRFLGLFELVIETASQRKRAIARIQGISDSKLNALIERISTASNVFSLKGRSGESKGNRREDTNELLRVLIDEMKEFRKEISSQKKRNRN